MNDLPDDTLRSFGAGDERLQLPAHKGTKAITRDFARSGDDHARSTFNEGDAPQDNE
jgi:hypothetical protein